VHPAITGLFFAFEIRDMLDVDNFPCRAEPGPNGAWRCLWEILTSRHVYADKNRLSQQQLKYVSLFFVRRMRRYTPGIS